MTFNDYADVRLGLEARLVESYEEELQKNAELDVERERLLQALRENFAKYGKVHAEAEELRGSIKASIAHMEAEWRREEKGGEL